MVNKTAKIAIMVEPAFRDAVNRKSEEMGIPYSEVVRRALETWLETGEMPTKPQAQKGGKKQSKTQ